MLVEGGAAGGGPSIEFDRADGLLYAFRERGAPIDMRGLRIFLIVVAAAAAVSSGALCQPLPMAKRPEDAGFSSERLERLRGQFKTDVEAGRFPGAVLLLARKGKIAAFDAVGFEDRKAKKAMRTDSIFRIASMTKPITSTAVMMLAEEGKIDIGAPVSKYLPEFKDVKVGADRAALKRPPTVHDLLRHTGGLTYGIFGNSPVDQLYQKAPIFTAKSLKELVSTIASLPLAHQPGEVWEYSISTDVLGRIVEVASDMEFDRFIATRITGPLKMTDTAFYLTSAQAARLAHSDTPMALGGDATVKPPAPSGGGGLLATAGDYGRFCQMLLNGGELEGARILSRKTVELMTSDQVPAATERRSAVSMLLDAFGPTPEMGTSFGLGFAVRVAAGRNPVPGSPGDFSWCGITGTYFWVDPKEDLVAVLMIQQPQAVPVWRETRTLVYQAMH